MNARFSKLAHLLVVAACATCLFAALTPPAARGEGSITFNGDNSVVNNTIDDILDGSHTITITIWAKATDFGEGGYGSLVVFQQAGMSNKRLVLTHGDDTNLYHVFVNWSGGLGQWNYGASDNTWHCHQMTYDITSASPPNIYVDGVLVEETQASPPIGTAPTFDPGYWVGNTPEGANTWEGDLAHVQFHDRILSKAELDACRQAPGSVAKGMRVWLPMQNATDVRDRSGNAFNGTAGGALADGSAPPVQTDLSPMPSGIRFLPAGITAVAQHIIPRYQNGSKHPSGELRGWGPMSIIAATTETDNQANPAIVVTEGNHVDPPEDISEWQNGSVPAEGNYGADPAVLQPTLTDCTIIGYIDGYDWRQEGDVNDVPRTNNQMDDDLYDGFDLYGNGGTVRNVGVFGIPGTAGRVRRRGSERSGFQLEHDRLRWHLDHLYARRCFRGFVLDATDMYCGHIEVEAVRDWGVHLGSSVQFGVIHVYGCGFAMPLSVGGGAAVWITGQQNLGGPLYVENSQIGLYDAGQHTTINGITSHTCAEYNILLAGQLGKVFGIDLRRAPVNIRMDGTGNVVHGGSIELAESGTGIQYNDGTIPDSSNIANNVRDIFINGYGDKDGDGDINGQPSEGGGAATDEHDADNAIGIDVNTTLKQVNITGVVIAECTTGIDFSGGNIANDGSVIWIFTQNVPNDVIWPSGQTWSKMPNGNDTRDIRINGERWYQQGI
jgi:hypothetical protein